MSTRTLQTLIPSQPTSDGAGVKLRRSLGARQSLRLDPFLMLDEFSSDDAADYLAGFPSHPHRGFETVTYILDGRMRHEDHMGHVGLLESGSVQWMTAGRGIIHSEMPEQDAGRMRGFQLWINLPAAEKMKPAAYRDIPPADIPVISLPNGGQVKIIAGSVESAGKLVQGPVGGLSTEPIYLDVDLPALCAFSLPVPEAHNAFVYAYEGSVSVGPPEDARLVESHAAGVLSPGPLIQARAGVNGARFLLLSARPIHEPVVQYGPFVMNTQQEIDQALRDYQNGVLTEAAG